jgi:hypothetical protein
LFWQGQKDSNLEEILIYSVFSNLWQQLAAKNDFLSGGEKIFKKIACGAYSVFSDLGVYVERGADILVTEDGL